MRRMSAIGTKQTSNGLAQCLLSGVKRTFGPNQRPKLVVCHCHPRAIVRMRIGLSTSNAMMAAAILRIAAT